MQRRSENDEEHERKAKGIFYDRVSVSYLFGLHRLNETARIGAISGLYPRGVRGESEEMPFGRPSDDAFVAFGAREQEDA